jgi:dUTP pyrophosphatase
VSETEVLKVRVLREGGRLPWRATPLATGYDLFACLDPGDSVKVGPDVIVVPTGIAIEAPAGYDVQVRPRSGLSRQGVTVEFGTIDADYRGEIFVSMHTFGSRSAYLIEHGDRIAQLVIGRAADIAIQVVEVLSLTARAESGHGSTGR